MRRAGNDVQFGAGQFMRQKESNRGFTGSAFGHCMKAKNV
jgi:hypothetical protein